VSKFRKKPVVVEAMQFVGTTMQENPTGPGTIQDWCRALVFDGSGGNPRIETLEGAMAVSAGDWVIKGVQGEFYPCKPDIFAATYEPVPD